MKTLTKKITAIFLSIVICFVAIPFVSMDIEAATIEKALYPKRVMNITQGVNGNYSHQGTKAIDNSSSADRNVYAPFTGIIKRIYTSSGNFVWLESKNPVQFADGTVDYMTMMFGHDNDISDLKVGKEIAQGTVFYKEGDQGQATGVHVHFECGKGKFSGTGWYQNSQGHWMINNSINPWNALWVTKDTTIKNDLSYSWKKTDSNIATTFTITYNANGGKGTMANTVVTHGVSTATRTNTFTKTGYTFDGWYAHRNSDNKWRYVNSKDSSDITWYLENSQPDNWIKYRYRDGASVKATAPVGSIVTFYAVWKANTYTVKYNANGGIGTMTDSSHTYGKAKSLTANAFTRENYTFLGWATSDNGEVKYTDKESVLNLTDINNGIFNLYAVWESIPIYTTTPEVTTTTLLTTTTTLTTSLTTSTTLTTSKTSSTETLTTLTTSSTITSTAKAKIGDVNCDGKISTADLILLAKAIAGRVTLTTAQITNANCYNGTGINSEDLLALIKFFIGEVSSLPILE